MRKYIQVALAELYALSVVRDIYIDATSTLATSVITGIYQNGEFQGNQPAGSLPGMKFATAPYIYEFMRGVSGSGAWCRYEKK
jgi:hypothetical protein